MSDHETAMKAGVEGFLGENTAGQPLPTLECMPGVERDIEDCVGDDDGGIDWDQIMADAEEDERLGVKPAFSTADYPDHETAMKAMRARIHGIFERAIRRAAATKP